METTQQDLGQEFVAKKQCLQFVLKGDLEELPVPREKKKSLAPRSQGFLLR